MRCWNNRVREILRCSEKKPTLCHLVHHKFPTTSPGIKYEPHQSHHNMQTFLEEDDLCDTRRGSEMGTGIIVIKEYHNGKPTNVRKFQEKKKYIFTYWAKNWLTILNIIWKVHYQPIHLPLTLSACFLSDTIIEFSLNLVLEVLH